jgi:SAM-dependent methyltransferase
VPGPVLPAALSEARRVLRDGGRLYVAEPLAEGPNFEITAEFHDETEVRAAAAKALDLHAAPAFASVRELSYTDRRSYPTFEAFATRMIANTRFNGYRAEDVTRPRVRERFAALARRHGGQFDQPVRVCLYG